MDIFFSVIIPLYNKEKDVEQTVNSVLEQSYQDFEIIIINDGSTDASSDVIKKIACDKIKLFETENNGAATARNIGVDKATAKYIAFLDADDYWYPHHLENLKSLIDKFPQGKWYGTAYEIMHNDRLILPMKSPIMNKGKDWSGKVDNYFKNSMIDCLAWTGIVCMTKSFFHKLGGFNINYDTGQDIDLWLRAALKSNLYFYNKISARYILIASNRLTKKPTIQKRYMNVDMYLDEESKNPFLKKYLDQNRFSYALKFKIAGMKSDYIKMLNNLNNNNLTTFQSFLLKRNKSTLYYLISLKLFFENNGLRLRLSRK